MGRADTRQGTKIGREVATVETGQEASERPRAQANSSNGCRSITTTDLASLSVVRGSRNVPNNVPE